MKDIMSPDFPAQGEEAAPKKGPLALLPPPEEAPKGPPKEDWSDALLRRAASEADSDMAHSDELMQWVEEMISQDYRGG